MRFKTADTIFIWKADATQTAGPATYDSYWLLNKTSPPAVNSWLKVGEVSGTDRGGEVLFIRDRSVFQRAKDAVPSYSSPAPWAP